VIEDDCPRAGRTLIDSEDIFQSDLIKS